MKVLVSRFRGFCAGVKNAVDRALSVPPENTFLLGELIHNEEVCRRIAERGIATVSSPEEIPVGASVLIRSHGVSEGTYRECEARRLNVIDCTCPFVKRTQEIVARESAAGKRVLIAGDPAHPEVRGLLGWCRGKAEAIASPEEIGHFEGEEVVLVAQTTISEKIFSKIAENLQKQRLKSLVIFPTICYTTVRRQKEAAEIARACDAVVVIGGLRSSNTDKLGEIASAQGKRVFRVARADDFEYEQIKFFGRVGVIAGASTPDWLTQEVLFKMVENNAEVQETEIKQETPVSEEAVEVEAETPAVEAKEEVVEEAPKSAMEQLYGSNAEPVPYKKGDIIKVSIVAADDEKIYVSGDGKSENVIAKQDLDCEEYSREAYKARVGEEIEVMVTGVKPVQLSEKLVRQMKEEQALLADVEAGKEFTVVCKGTNKGGLTAELGSYPVFIPRREIRIGYVADLEKYVGKTLRLKVQKPEDIRKTGRKEIIASQRVILEAERAAKEAAKAEKESQFFSSIKVGDVVEGKVERVTSFGAFVSVNGFDCLAHISDLSWTGVKEVGEVLEIGKRYQFKVLKVDSVNKKVSIGYKQLQPQPWDLAAEKYAEGDIVHGKVVRIVPFGAFVELEKGIDGLVHVSQITHEWLENPTSALTIGQEVDAKITAFNPAEKRITLSIKALMERPEYEQRPERETRERTERDENAPRARRQKGGRRTAQSYAEEEEYREWTEGGNFGASISELLHLDDDDENK